MARVAHKLIQAKTARSRSWFGGLIDARQERKQIEKAVATLVQRGNSAGFIRFYSRVLTKEGRECAFKRIVEEFIKRTRPFERVLTGENVAAAIGICRFLQHIGENSDTLYKEDENETFDRNVRVLTERIRLVLKKGDDYASKLYQKHPDLRVACAKAVWDGSKQINMERTAEETAQLAEVMDTVEGWAQDPILCEVALDIVFEAYRKMNSKGDAYWDYPDVLMPAITGIIRGYIAASTLERKAAAEEPVFGILSIIVAEAENSERGELIEKLSRANRTLQLAIISRWAERAAFAGHALRIAAKSGCISDDEKQALIGRVFECGHLDALRDATHLKGMQKAVLAKLLTTAEGRERIAGAIDETGDEEAMLRTLASFGEQAIRPLLDALLADPEHAEHAFGISELLPETSPSLRAKIFDMAYYAQYQDGEGISDGLKERARRTLEAMNINQAKFVLRTITGTLNAIVSAVGQHLPDSIAMLLGTGRIEATAETERNRIAVLLGFRTEEKE